MRAAGERALVLGGGGSTGNAWLIGVVAGLFDAGLDVTTADLTIGTSAGATAAAQLAGATPTELFAAILAAPAAVRVDGAASGPVADHLERMSRIIASADDAGDMRRRLGAAALERQAASDGSWQAQWRATVASRLPGQRWPNERCSSRRSMPTPVNRSCSTTTAESSWRTPSPRAAPVAFPTGSGTTATSTAGYRSNAENADLAAGYARVLVLSPFGGRSLTPPEWGTHLAAQVDELRAGGSRVETIFPDSSSEHMFGANAMDLSLRPPAARAGYDQGGALAEQLTEFWR